MFVSSKINVWQSSACDRPLEHEELMQRVFQEVIATGRYQCTPGVEGGLDLGEDNDDQTETEGEGNTVGMEIGNEIDSSGSERKTPSSGTDAISMNNILQNLAKKKQYKYVVKHRYNMADVMRVVSQMEYFKDPTPPVYWWLIDHLAEDPMKMQIFVGLQNDAQRISLIQREHTKAMMLANGQFNPYGTIFFFPS
ncbi:hypothetical protein RHGRI_013447 [Rhododendron griersonianum]|uniref:Uncharacterized protein n=1 Tax=Rhododendron griersonianum TaxID=479676 RepID=A0AAV6K5X8_9ERIC|nr:hypothetical protein RHGRI_013447 [Rhododendron griersonianum]